MEGKNLPFESFTMLHKNSVLTGHRGCHFGAGRRAGGRQHALAEGRSAEPLPGVGQRAVLRAAGDNHVVQAAIRFAVHDIGVG